MQSFFPHDFKLDCSYSRGRGTELFSNYSHIRGLAARKDRK